MTRTEAPNPPTEEQMLAWLRKRVRIYVPEAAQGEAGRSIIIKRYNSKSRTTICIPYDSVESAYRRLNGVIP